MKCAVILRRFERTGGASRSTAEVVDYLHKDHHYDIDIVSFVCDNVEPFEKRILNSYGLNRINNNYLRNLFEVPLFTLVSFFWILKNRRKYDIIWGPLGNSIYRGVCVAQSCHKALFKLKLKNREFKSLLNPLHYWVLLVEWVNVKTSKGIVCISQVVKDDYLSNYKVDEEKMKVIHHSANITEFIAQGAEFRNTRERIRKNFNRNNDEVLLCFAGYEYKRKGLHLILNALRSLPDSVHLFVVGEDLLNKSYFVERSQEFNGRVHFIGNTDQIRDYFIASDVFVFPSSMDAFGLVVYEAMACGLPVITTKTTGASELMDGNGYVLEYPVDENEFSDHLESLVSNHDLRAAFSEKSREITRNYTWEHAAQRYHQYFESILKSCAND